MEQEAYKVVFKGCVAFLLMETGEKQTLVLAAARKYITGQNKLNTSI